MSVTWRLLLPTSVLCSALACKGKALSGPAGIKRGDDQICRAGLVPSCSQTLHLLVYRQHLPQVDCVAVAVQECELGCVASPVLVWHVCADDVVAL